MFALVSPNAKEYEQVDPSDSNNQCVRVAILHLRLPNQPNFSYLYELVAKYFLRPEKK
jgi:hypothetical protein